MSNRTILILRLLLILVLLVSCSSYAISKEQSKILFVNSYHKGYRWSDEIEKGVRKALRVKAVGDRLISQKANGVELKLFRMDTKINLSEVFKKEAALAAKKIIEEWQPDVVIASDDNASKYLVAPYYKNTDLPIVFCGINWDASAYGFPVSNITGMIEIDPLLETIAILNQYSKGTRIGYLGSDDISNQKKLPFHKELLKIDYTDGKLISTFDEWKREYLRLQASVDMLIIFSPIGITGWNDKEAANFIIANTTIPSGNIEQHTSHLALVGRVKLAEEQGWWAGKAALEILKDISPADIPVAKNKHSKVYLNMVLAKHLGVKFPMELIKNATFIEAHSGE